jgi:hypothetical protein
MVMTVVTHTGFAKLFSTARLSRESWQPERLPYTARNPKLETMSKCSRKKIRNHPVFIIPSFENLNLFRISIFEFPPL